MNAIFNFVSEVMSLFANWFSVNSNEWAWCRVRVDNRFDRF